LASSINASTTAGLVNTADTSAILQLQTGGTTAISIDASQAVTMAGRTTNPTTISVGNATPSTSGAGITFPATQSASTNANTLDDYEEGTWTPSFTLNAGSATLTSASGSYVKIGKQVTVLFNISFATATAATIDTITGFTFPFANNTQYGVGALRENSNTGFIWQLRGNGNATTATIRKYDNTQVLTAGDTFVGTLVYFTD